MVGSIWLARSATLNVSSAERNVGRTETGMHWIIASIRAGDYVMLDRMAGSWKSTTHLIVYLSPFTLGANLSVSSFTF